MTYLLDVSTLIALLWADHEAHSRVKPWQAGKNLAVCPITELGFLRISTQAFGAEMNDARRTLARWLEERRPKFVPCDLKSLEGLPAKTPGKTTDFYLANLASAKEMQLATLDEGIGHPAVFVIP